MDKLMWRHISKGRSQVFFEGDTAYTVQYLPVQKHWRAYFDGAYLPGVYKFRNEEAAHLACQNHHDENRGTV